MNENFNAEYTVKLWYNGRRSENPSLEKETQAIGIVSFKKKRENEVSCKKEDIKVVFEGITSNKIPYMGAIFNMKGVSKQARNFLKRLDCFKNAIDNME